MADTFTTHARLRKPEVGANRDLWGTLLNQTFDLIEELSLGVVEIVIAGNTNLPAIGDGASSNSRRAALVLTGAPGAAFDLVFPVGLVKWFFVANNTNGACTVKYAAQSGGAVIPVGSLMMVVGDGTDVVGVEAEAPGIVAEATNALNLGGVAAANYARLAVSQNWTRSQAVTFTNLGNVSGTVTPDATLSNNYRARLTGNITLAVPVSLKDGQAINVLLVQDGSGNRTMTLSGAWRTPNGAQFALSTAPNATDILSAVFYDGFLYANLAAGFGSI